MRDRARWPVFWALVGVFVLAVLLVVVPPAREALRMDILLLTAGIALLVLGGALIFLAARERRGRRVRAFLILTGASAAGIPVSVVLHNLVYGLFIYWFGAGFWESIGLPDEPVFFFLGLVISPLAFLVGSIGTIVLAVRRS